jgi:hypothetical protein
VTLDDRALDLDRAHELTLVERPETLQQVVARNDRCLVDYY